MLLPHGMEGQAQEERFGVGMFGKYGLTTCSKQQKLCQCLTPGPRTFFSSPRTLLAVGG